MNSKKITMFRQASEFTAFHKKLGVLIGHWLDSEWSVLDLGCGLGLIDFEIAPHVKSITAVDYDETVIKECKAQIERELDAGHGYAEKIEPICADAKDISGEWDIVLMSFFGADFNDMKKYFNHAAKRVIVIVHERASSGIFGPAIFKSKRRTAAELDAFLKKESYVHTKTIAEMQFGQPFKTIDDVGDFLERLEDADKGRIILPELMHEGEPDIDFDVEKIALNAEERIIMTGRYDFPYYLPCNVSVGLFCVNI